MKASLELARKGISISLCLLGFCLPLTIAGANISWVLLLVSLLAYMAAGGMLPLKARKSALEKPLWLYLGVAALAALLGMNPARSLLPLRQDAHKLWLYMLFSVGLALNPADEALACMALGFAAAAALGIVQALSFPTRAHAFVHPVTFGGQAAIALLGAVCFLARPEGTSKTWRRRLTWGLVLLTGAALVLSNTRGAGLGLAAGLAGVFLIYEPPRLMPRKALIALLLATAGILAMELIRPDRSLVAGILAKNTPQATNQGPLTRLVLWKVAWRMGKDHPWTGVGLNNYREALPNYFSGTFEDHERSWGTAHNLYLHQFAERGLLGLVALVWLLGALWGRAFVRARSHPNAWNLWAFGTATAFLVINLTEVALQTELLWMLVFFIWIWAEARHRLVKAA